MLEAQRRLSRVRLPYSCSPRYRGAGRWSSFMQKSAKGGEEMLMRSFLALGIIYMIKAFT